MAGNATGPLTQYLVAAGQTSDRALVAAAPGAVKAKRFEPRTHFLRLYSCGAGKNC